MNATLARLTRLADPCREPDGRLLDAFLAGSEHAFRELVDRHGRLVFGVCTRLLRHRQDAEDAFQATFLVLARRAADVWPRDAVGSWLYGVAYRVALKARAVRVRRLGREQQLEDVAQQLPPIPEPDTAEIIDRAIRKLPESYRAAVVACDLEGLSRKAAAAQLGWKEGTLSGRLARARELLAVRLRKAGLVVPAGGVAAALGANPTVQAGLVERAIGVALSTAAGGVSAPVAALSEGVVQGMFAVKLKAAVAVVLVACSLGVGAWAAGNGDGPGTGTPPQPPTAKTEAGKDAAAEKPAWTPADWESLRGFWFVESVDTTGTPTPTSKGQEWPVFEITGVTLTKPYRGAGSEWKWQKYDIDLDTRATPHAIDLTGPGKAVERGIYEFVAPAKTCAACHEIPKPGPFATPKDVSGLCGPGLKQVFTKPGLGLRLAIGTDGKRPTKFGGGQGVVEYRLTRVDDENSLKTELNRDRDRRAAAQAISAATSEHVQNPRLFAARLNLATVEKNYEEAQKQLAQTRVAFASAHSEEAALGRYLERARAEFAAAEEEARKTTAARPKEAAKDDPAFTVHVRPLAAAEKVIRVKATGKETVLEALAYAAEDMALKGEALTVWVARGKEILPVDLVDITQHRVTTTNYVLKAGDQLFVQVKVGK